MALTAEQRKIRASIAGSTGWANTIDRSARGRNMRAGLEKRFERLAIEAVGQDVWDRLKPKQQARCIDTQRNIHNQRVALAASKARTAKAAARRREKAKT